MCFWRVPCGVSSEHTKGKAVLASQQPLPRLPHIGSLPPLPLTSCSFIFVKAAIVCPYSFCNFLYIFNVGFFDRPLIWLFLDLFIPAQIIDPIDLCVLSAFIHSFIAPCISLVSCVCLTFSSRFSSLGFQQGIYLGFLRHTFEYSTQLCCVSQSSLVFGICHE